MRPFGTERRQIVEKMLRKDPGKQAIVGIRVPYNDKPVAQIYIFEPPDWSFGEWSLFYTEDPEAPKPLEGSIPETQAIMDRDNPEDNPFRDTEFINSVLRQNLKRMESVLKQQGAEIVFFKPYESSNIETWPPSKEPKNRDLPP